MLQINSLGIIGGDIRQLYCARSAADDGLGIYLAGFEKCTDTAGLPLTSPEEAIMKADALILPLPVSKDGKTLNAPFSAHEHQMTVLMDMISDSKPVFRGFGGALPNDYFSGKKSFCYSSRDEFAAANAVPTAEGAICIAMQESDAVLNGSSVLVVGYGRIGRVLSHMLYGLGARVSVSARKASDLEMISASGMIPEKTDSIRGSYDIIFNTVPALVLDARTLARCASGAIVIDLASLPGGVDDEAACRMSIKVIHALSLPGKTSPKSAGIIIKKAVYNIIGEE